MSPTKNTAVSAAGTTNALVRALRHLLRPVVRLLLTNQFTHPDLASLLKSVYVDVAEAELAAGGERRTASRVSLLTGLQRKDLRRLSEAVETEYAPPHSVSLGARLVRRWTSSRRYLDSRRRPRPLPRHAGSSGRGASFEDLVAEVSTDIRPRAVLDEWLRLGVVEIDSKDRVRLCVEGFVPKSGFDEKAHLFGRNVHDHIAAAAHNLAGGDVPMMERSVYYENLSPRSVAELEELAERLGMDTLRALNRRAQALQRRDAGAGDQEQRINFGVYFYRSDPERAGHTDD